MLEPLTLRHCPLVYCVLIVLAEGLLALLAFVQTPVLEKGYCAGKAISNVP